MITNSAVNQYSPNSEESDEQPLDFSKTRISSATLTAINIKNENNSRHHRHESTPSPQLSHRSSPQQPPPPPTNCFTTPSPSPPEHHSSHHTNQVLCQLLTGNLIPTATGKLVSAINTKSGDNSLSIQQHIQSESAIRFNGVDRQSSPVGSNSSPPNQSVMQAINERHNSSMSPTGSVSPIGLGPLNQVEMHFSHSPNANGVDRFGTSGGLLTTASTAGVFTAANDSAKRALKYNRPFKAYPRDPLSIPMGYYGVVNGLQMPLTADAIATQSLLATASDQAYLQFREQMLVSRKNTQTQEPRRTSGGSQNVPKNSTLSTPEMSNPNNTNGNNTNSNSNNTHNSNNGNNHQNIYLNRAITPPMPKEAMHTIGPKLNGSSPMTPISTAVSHINSDETSQYSNRNSSANSSSGEEDLGSLASNSGQLSDGQSSMRKRGRPLPEDLKDEAYWERRRKNNEAAKRSRDARRAKEDEIAIRAAFLEQENLKLRCEIAQLKSETTKLRCLLYNS